ncbi:hypothetical protein GV827_18075 [Sulfitobacter sp. JBTF-M27]|uniref:Uncharacterized protein n=1 Tax=Sulfitobacter sediminilitoris TaxID=2698830 RepID=A0A6P0CGT3_9RHOB|nr:hypothetical protein [Sulfitobacter sediminilitoris]NEK24296.1 hypothetical protein [Sulfitobacter sediminilitoris]
METAFKFLKFVLNFLFMCFQFLITGAVIILIWEWGPEPVGAEGVLFTLEVKGVAIGTVVFGFCCTQLFINGLLKLTGD